MRHKNEGPDRSVTPDELLKSFDQGTPTLDDLGRGMHLCYLNARALVRDARLLLMMSPGRAFSLSVLALEEIGKILVLATLTDQAAAGTLDVRTLRRALQSHARKQSAVAPYGRILLPRVGKSYRFDIPEDMTQLLDRFKQLGLYTDWLGEGFLAPASFWKSNKDWARWAVRAARERVVSFAELHDSPEKSVFIARRLQESAQAIRANPTEEGVRAVLRQIVNERADFPRSLRDRVRALRRRGRTRLQRVLRR